MPSTEFKLKILTLNTSKLLASSFNTLSSDSPELVDKLNDRSLTLILAIIFELFLLKKDKEYPIIDINNNIIVTINIYIYIFYYSLSF